MMLTAFLQRVASVMSYYVPSNIYLMLRNVVSTRGHNVIASCGIGSIKHVVNSIWLAAKHTGNDRAYIDVHSWSIQICLWWFAPSPIFVESKYGKKCLQGSS